MAKLVRHLTSNEEIVSSNLAEGIFFCEMTSQLLLVTYHRTVAVPFICYM